MYHEACRPWEKKHGCEWLLGEPSAAAQDPRIQSCVVEPGQVIYVPTSWHHATCNLDEFTLAVSLHEADDAARLQGEGSQRPQSSIVGILLDGDGITACAQPRRVSSMSSRSRSF